MPRRLCAPPSVGDATPNFSSMMTAHGDSALQRLRPPVELRSDDAHIAGGVTLLRRVEGLVKRRACQLLAIGNRISASGMEVNIGCAIPLKDLAGRRLPAFILGAYPQEHSPILQRPRKLPRMRRRSDRTQ